MESGERDCAGGFHSTSLMKAARSDQPELVEKALECTANNIDAVGSDGRTALMIAAALGHLRVVRALCNAGADLNLVDGNGRSALDAAIRSEHAEIAALLCVQPAATPCQHTMPTRPFACLLGLQEQRGCISRSALGGHQRGVGRTEADGRGATGHAGWAGRNAGAGRGQHAARVARGAVLRRESLGVKSSELLQLEPRAQRPGVYEITIRTHGARAGIRTQGRTEQLMHRHRWRKL